jgi:Helix-turn-helix domain of resolvase
MANNPISMVKIRQILRLHSQGTSKVQIAVQTGTSRNTLKSYLKEFEGSKLSYGEISVLSDKDLEDLFVKPGDKQLPDKLQQLFSLFPGVDKALKKKGVTQFALWEDTNVAILMDLAEAGLIITSPNGKTV